MNELLVFIEMKQNFFILFEEKKSKWPLKKPHFPAPPILNIFHENFMDWSLG
jgi:hypothetical protein